MGGLCTPSEEGLRVWKLSVPTLSHVRVAEASFQSLSFPIWIMGVGRERPGYGGTPFLVSGVVV